MSDTARYSDPFLENNIPDSNSPSLSPPPAGNPDLAEKYLVKLINLIQQGKLHLSRTNLGDFNFPTMQDHYRVVLGEYDVEVSHNINPNTKQELYTMLFNNIKRIESEGESCNRKVILAYMHLTPDQFNRFKRAALETLEKRKAVDDQRKVTEALAPIDHYLSMLESNEL